jgi:hypothetical protein
MGARSKGFSKRKIGYIKIPSIKKGEKIHANYQDEYKDAKNKYKNLNDEKHGQIVDGFELPVKKIREKGMHIQKPNPDNKTEVDHINNNRLDNRVANLRWTLSSENNANRIKKDGGTSKYKGVYWHKKANKWNSRIMKDKITEHLGLFTNEKYAADKYNERAIELFGEFAKLNEISDDE